MDEEKLLHRRSAILLGLFIVCLTGFVFLLYDAQVVNAESYLAQSSTQVTTSQTVEAYRGILTDRNGKVLASNREVYTITFDPELVEAEEGESPDEAVNRAILRLIDLSREQGVAWSDTLPVSPSRPFIYPSATAGQRRQLTAYLDKRGWSALQLREDAISPLMSASLRFERGAAGGQELTAPILMELLRERYGLDESFTPEAARLIAGVRYELELRTLEINNTAYLFAQDIPVEMISILSDGAFEGVAVASRSVRQYNTDYAAHVLGQVGDIQTKEERAALNQPYTDAKAAAEAAGEEFSAADYHYYYLDDKVGKFGAEQAFESYLRGRDGTRLVTTNESGKITSELYGLEPEPGDTVALTIDIDFQAAVEQALARAVEEMNAADESETRGAAAAVVSVADSDVLALASYPSFTPQNYYSDYITWLEDPGMPLTNRATNGAYAPGSTFKPITAVAALESGIITPATKILTKGRYTYWSDYQPACWLYRQGGGSHGSINVSDAIYHSCNYFFYEVGRLMGIETLNRYAAGFGLGQSTGIELGERTGILDGPQYRQEAGSLWVGGTVLACAIGQGDSLFTPLQLANYTATLVRGGQRYDAHLLESVSTYDGSATLYRHQPETVDTVEMSPATLAAVKQGMGDLVESGSVSRYFDSCVVSAGAKTGSAQTGAEVANGVFVCFAPFDEPEIAVAIVIEQGGSGAALASTAVEILNAYFEPGDIGTAVVPEGALLP